jgi:hypothetical protein
MRIHLDDDSTRGLSPKGKATAIAMLVSSGVRISSEIDVLSHWQGAFRESPRTNAISAHFANGLIGITRSIISTWKSGRLRSGSRADSVR